MIAILWEKWSKLRELWAVANIGLIEALQYVFFFFFIKIVLDFKQEKQSSYCSLVYNKMKYLGEFMCWYEFSDSM